MATTQKENMEICERQDGARQFVLRPKDNDMFVQTGKQLIDACRLNISIEVWRHELDSMSEHVVKWAEHFKAQVRSIYLAPRSSKMVLFLSPTSDSFDFDLADEMAKLSTHVLKTFNVGMVEILQVPSEELERFVDGGKAQLLYGEQVQPHQSVEA